MVSPGLTGGATSILLAYLKSKGLVHPRDFSLAVVAGGTPARLSALESNAVAGAVLGIPFADIAIDKGFNEIRRHHRGHFGLSVQQRKHQSCVGRKKSPHGGQVFEGPYPVIALDLRPSGGCDRISHQRIRAADSVRAQGYRVLHPEEGLSEQRRRDADRTQSKHRSSGAGRHYQRCAAPAGKVCGPELSASGTERAAACSNRIHRRGD